MTTRLKSSGHSSPLLDADAAVLATSTHPHSVPRAHSESLLHPPNVGQVWSAPDAPLTPEQQSALLASLATRPHEINDSMHSWVDVQESIDDAMRESPVPGGRISVGSAVSIMARISDRSAICFSGPETPGSRNPKLSLWHASTERLLQDAQESPSGNRTSSPQMMTVSPLYIDSPDLMSLHSQSPPPGDDVGSPNSILERICFDRVSAAAASLDSQVRSGAIDSEKVISGADDSDWVWDWSSRPELTPPKDAQYKHQLTKRKSFQHRKRNPRRFCLRLDVFSIDNLPVLLVSHACTLFLGAALMLMYLKKRRS